MGSLRECERDGRGDAIVHLRAQQNEFSSSVLVGRVCGCICGFYLQEWFSSGSAKETGEGMQ